MSAEPDMESRFARIAPPAVWIAMPLLGLANQYCAERVAQLLRPVPLSLAWAGIVVRSPWMQTWVCLEFLTLLTWMTVLSEFSLSAAFPLTAVGYVMVIGLGWLALGEPASLLQVLGGAAILAGVWILGQAEDPE